jgi:hypothetical protein
VEATGENSTPQKALQASEIFKEGRRKRIRSLNGIEVDLMASVHEVPGNSVIEGDVPDEVQLVVMNGGVTVNGFVGGNIIAEGTIVINGNATGGWIISSKGNVRIQGGLANVRIISKSGTVTAGRLENPACVFGWKGIEVGTTVSGGKVYGGFISIGESAAGGQLHTTGGITVPRLGVTARGDTIVCLRETLSCEDYGRPMSEEETRLQRSIGRFLYTIDVTSRLLRYARTETYDSYKTFLYTLLCGNLNAQKIRTLRGLQCQANFLDEIIGIAEAYVTFFNKYRQLEQEPNHDEAHTLAAGSIDSVRTVQDDVNTMSSAFRLQYKGIVINACNYLSSLSKKLDHNEIRMNNFQTHTQELLEGLSRWRTLADELNAEIKVHVSSFGLAPAVAQTVEAHPEKAQPMLEKVIAQLAKDPGSPRYQRVKSPLVRLLQTSIDRNRKNMINWDRQRQAAMEELETVREELASNATTMFKAASRGSTYVEAQTYEAGVVLASNPIPKSDPLQTAVMTVRLSENIDVSTVFELKDGQIERKRKRTAEAVPTPQAEAAGQ